MVTATESSAPTSAILPTASEVPVMDKEVIINEAACQVAVELAELMLKKKLITPNEYSDFQEEMLRKYKPVFSSLYR